MLNANPVAKGRGLVSVRAEASAHADVKATLSELTKTYAEFREANDERFKGIEAKFDDVVTNEKVDKINAEVTRLQEALDVAVRDVASLEINGGGNAEDPDKVRARAEAFLAGAKNVEAHRATDDEIEAVANYRKPFATYLRRGDQAMRSADVQAAMQIGSDPDGGYWVPPEMGSRIITRLFETSPMRSLAGVMSITTDRIEWPNDTNDATSGGWVGETESRTETATPDVGMQTIYVREQFAEPRVTQRLLDMSGFDVEGWLAGKIADKMVRTENTAFVSGTGVDQPRGFLDYKSAAVTADDDSRSWGVLQYTPSGASAGFPTVSGVPSASDPDALITMVSKLKPAYRGNARWVMNRATEAALRKLKDGDGNYFVGTITNAAAGFDLLGFPIVTAEDMPDIGADSYSIAFGDFGVGYQIVDGRGIRVLRDNLTTKGRVKFYTTKFTGGDVLNFDAIKLMKFATS